MTDLICSEFDKLNASLGSLADHVRARDAHIAARLDQLLDALLIVHDADPAARRRLNQLRLHDEYDAAYTIQDPLVTVIIPTWQRVELLLNRALPSVLSQSHANLEVLIIGDGTSESVGRAIARVSDPRVRFENLTYRGPYSTDPRRSWLAAGTPPMNRGLAAALGHWITFLGDDDAFLTDHVERLLEHARRHRFEFVYGRINAIRPDGRREDLGTFPPQLGQIQLQASLLHSGLRFYELELGHALFGIPNDWGFITRLMRTGVRIGMLDEPVVDYWASPAAEDTAAAHESDSWSVSALSAAERREAAARAHIAHLEQTVNALQEANRSSANREEAARDQLARYAEEIASLRADVIRQSAEPRSTEST